MTRFFSLLVASLLLAGSPLPTLPAPQEGSPPPVPPARTAPAPIAGAPAPTSEAGDALPDAATLELQADLERLIAGLRWRNDRWSVMVVSLDRGDTLFSHNAGMPLAPASNLKLFTTAAALYYLGADFRFNTFLLADGPIVDGVLHGDLVLYGTGDPTLSDRFGLKEAVWQAFADTVAALGIHQVSGDIVGDASYFGDDGVGDGWETDYVNASYAAPASALPYAENIATLQIKPGPHAGSRAEVRLVPGGEGIALLDEATTVAGGRTRVSAARRTYDGPVVVSGKIPLRSRGVFRAVPIADAADYAAAAFRQAMVDRGITVTGSVRSVRQESDSPVSGRLVFAPAFDHGSPVRVLAIHNSPPLLSVLEVVNKRSHNLMAEQTLRAVGRVALGEGTAAAGVRAVRYMLDCEIGGDSLVLEQHDGSGLSPLNRVSARSVVRLLSYMAGSPMWDDYWSTLPEAGARDGLHRMYRTAAVANLRAKTGTINHVSALSGMVHSAGGERLAFSIISNDVPSTWKAKRIEDRIGIRLATFARSTGPSAPTDPAVAREADVADGQAGSEQSGSATTGGAETARYHTIREGDTLEGIARKYGIQVTDLRRVNPGLDPRRLIPGKRVVIPDTRGGN